MSTDEVAVDIIALHIVPTPTITISPSGRIQGAMVGIPHVINCTVNTVNGVEISSVMIRWIRARGVYLISDTRVAITPTTSSGSNTYISSLQFAYLMEGDEGIYNCIVMILETSISTSVNIQSLISKLYIALIKILVLNTYH